MEAAKVLCLGSFGLMPRGVGALPKRESLEEQEQGLWPSLALKTRSVCTS